MPSHEQPAGGAGLRPYEIVMLFDELRRPLDRATVRDGFQTLAEWLGRPRHRKDRRGLSFNYGR